MENNEQYILERRLAEQEIVRQSLEERDARLRELEQEVKYLRRLLNEALAAPRPLPQLQLRAGEGTVPRPGGAVPRRWRI